jgi:hypothetical protein
MAIHNNRKKSKVISQNRAILRPSYYIQKKAHFTTNQNNITWKDWSQYEQQKVNGVSVTE